MINGVDEKLLKILRSAPDICSDPISEIFIHLDEETSNFIPVYLKSEIIKLNHKDIYCDGTFSVVRNSEFIKKLYRESQNSELEKKNFIVMPNWHLLKLFLNEDRVSNDNLNRRKKSTLIREQQLETILEDFSSLNLSIYHKI